MYWYKNYATGYKPQFVRNTLIKLDQTPLKHLAYESDGTTYKNIRKLMFTYNVYDARTGEYINMDLSKYVVDVNVSESDLEMTQQMYQDKVIKRQKTLNERADRIQPDLINEAQEKYIKLVEETEYRKALVDLQNNGMNYISALNFIPLESDIKDKESTKTAKSHEPSKQQIAEQKTQEKPRWILHVFKKATSKIKENLFPKQFRKTSNDGIDYE